MNSGHIVRDSVLVRSLIESAKVWLFTQPRDSGITLVFDSVVTFDSSHYMVHYSLRKSSLDEELKDLGKNDGIIALKRDTRAIVGHIRF